MVWPRSRANSSTPSPPSGTTLTLAPFGRGYRGTQPSEHAINTQVTFDPAFPRAEIKRSINQSVAALYPTLFRIQTVDVPVEVTSIGRDHPGGVRPAEGQGALVGRVSPRRAPRDGILTAPGAAAAGSLQRV